MREEGVAKAVPGLAQVLVPNGEKRTLDASAQVERAGRCCRRFDSGIQAKPRFLEMATKNRSQTGEFSEFAIWIYTQAKAWAKGMKSLCN